MRPGEAAVAWHACHGILYARAPNYGKQLSNFSKSQRIERIERWMCLRVPWHITVIEARYQSLHNLKTYYRPTRRPPGPQLCGLTLNITGSLYLNDRHPNPSSLPQNPTPWRCCEMLWRRSIPGKNHQISKTCRRGSRWKQFLANAGGHVLFNVVCCLMHAMVQSIV